MAPTLKRKGKYQPKPTSGPNWLLIGGLGALILVVILVVVNIVFAQAPAPVAVASGRVLGKDNAPVTIQEYADFQCPVCGRADTVLRQIVPQYVDTGKAKLEYHYFAFIGAESQWAAEAAECATDQKKFWEFADYVYRHQAGENQGAFSRANLKTFAGAVGLDMTAFNACFDGSKYTDLVKRETDDGRSRGVKATPTFFIGGQKYEGLLSATQFGQIIAALAR